MRWLRMSRDKLPQPAKPVQTAELSLKLGKHSGLDMRLGLTSRGILSVAVLVSGILLSTAVLVGVAVREGRR